MNEPMTDLYVTYKNKNILYSDIVTIPTYLLHRDAALYTAVGNGLTAHGLNYQTLESMKVMAPNRGTNIVHLD